VSDLAFSFTQGAALINAAFEYDEGFGIQL
jgi:hypothetical protein